jgi:hypothetical protein
MPVIDDGFGDVDNPSKNYSTSNCTGSQIVTTDVRPGPLGSPPNPLYFATSADGFPLTTPYEVSADYLSVSKQTVSHFYKAGGAPVHATYSYWQGPSAPSDGPCPGCTCVSAPVYPITSVGGFVPYATTEIPPSTFAAATSIAPE